MNTQAWLTILPFLGAVAGAIIGATISPLVQWQFEKKRQRVAYRRELIARWRAMIEEVARTPNLNSSDEEINSALMKRAEFFSFLIYTKGAPRSLSEESAEIVRELGLHPVLAVHLQEIVVLEHKWELV